MRSSFLSLASLLVLTACSASDGSSRDTLNPNANGKTGSGAGNTAGGDGTTAGNGSAADGTGAGTTGDGTGAGTTGNGTGAGAGTTGDGTGAGTTGTGATGTGTTGTGAGTTGSTTGTGTTGTLVAADDDVLILVENMATPAGCGDGILTDDEACDDGNISSGDGCSANCLQLEPGFSCAGAGEPCRAIARCSDGIVAPSEQCDDGNAADGDGCSARCRIELGKKCEGAPSVCTDAECGNDIVEGAEACDDGNNAPFDGCSSLCLREPNCEGLSCTSECGDGLVIDEGCDDGNTVSGDGCSSTCEPESGFECTQEATCEKINGECVLRVPTIFRDFSSSHTDFGDKSCALELGMVQNDLDAKGRPVTASGNCVQSAESFSEWYTDNDKNVTFIGNIVLYDNGDGGYVNRFNEDGTPFEAIALNSDTAGCEGSCTTEANNSLNCMNSACQTERNDADQAGRDVDNGRNQGVDDDELEELEAAADAAALAATECADACDADHAAYIDECVSSCAPCSYDVSQMCHGGTVVSYDGNPLFFPVDHINGDTNDAGRAKLPDTYGYDGWPWEDEFFPNAGNHNFYFTSEVQYWFRYEADTDATLAFSGDDDVWVFINGKLAVDLGGIHVPESDEVTINAGSARDFDLEAGNVYKITIFHAERKMEGSSFKLTLAGFEATPSDCTAICGDGVLSFGEECDDGINDGGYGECDAGCKLGPYCGDSIVQGTESCDNGPGGGDGCPNCRILVIR